MKKKLTLIFVFTFMLSSLFAQKVSKVLKVYSITEYVDGYFIKVIDTSIVSADTINIISAKTIAGSKKGMKKVAVGEKYKFTYEDYANTMAAMPPDGFVIRIKTTVVWRGTDRIKDRPVFSKNMKGLWILE